MKLGIKTIRVTFAVIICIFVISRIAIVMSEGEKGRLKRTIYKNKRLIEKEDIIALANNISPDYSDELGNDKGTLLFIARSFFNEYRNILIFIDSLEIEIKDGNATAYAKATVYWRENTLEDIIYDTVEVESRFQKEKKHWKLIEIKFLESEKKLLLSPRIA